MQSAIRTSVPALHGPQNLSSSDGMIAYAGPNTIVLGSLSDLNAANPSFSTLKSPVNKVLVQSGHLIVFDLSIIKIYSISDQQLQFEYRFDGSGVFPTDSIVLPDLSTVLVSTTKGEVWSFNFSSPTFNKLSSAVLTLNQNLIDSAIIGLAVYNNTLYCLTESSCLHFFSLTPDLKASAVGKCSLDNDVCFLQHKENLIAIGHLNGMITLFDTRISAVVSVINMVKMITCICLTREDSGYHLIVGSEDTTLTLFSVSFDLKNIKKLSSLIIENSIPSGVVTNEDSLIVTLAEREELQIVKM
ncbi:hypothetical protein P9112_008606 [Eukaryota sp. TZLM1-RC]